MVDSGNFHESLFWASGSVSEYHVLGMIYRELDQAAGRRPQGVGAARGLEHPTLGLSFDADVDADARGYLVLGHTDRDKFDLKVCGSESEGCLRCHKVCIFLTCSCKEGMLNKLIKSGREISSVEPKIMILCFLDPGNQVCGDEFR